MPVPAETGSISITEVNVLPLQCIVITLITFYSLMKSKQSVPVTSKYIFLIITTENVLRKQ